MERRLGIMQSVEPVLENAIKTLQKVVDVRGMGKSVKLQLAAETPEETEFLLLDKEEAKAAAPEEEKKAAPAKKADGKPKKKCEWKPPALEKVEKEEADKGKSPAAKGAEEGKKEEKKEE